MPSSGSAQPDTCDAASAGSLRLVTIGHVDHGKSTLVGRLLVESGTLPPERLAELRAVSERRGLALEYAFAIDALQAERDQGITIDAAHVWLTLGGRRFEVIDAPGHAEFLRNMITGAARADAALLVVDAREGLGAQSRQHAYLLGILGIAEVIVVVNKMDLIGYDEARYRTIARELGDYLGAIGAAAPRFVPASAVSGANILAPAPELAWHDGPTVAGALAALRPRPFPGDAPLRFPVQDVYRVGERRVLVGRVESGTLREGDELVFSPWNKVGFVKSIERWGAPPRPWAAAGESIGIVLDAPLYVERGQVASHQTDAPVETDVFDAKLFWLAGEPLVPGRALRLQVVTEEVACRVERIERVVDLETLGGREAERVERNQIAEATIRTARPVAIDDFAAVAATGRFVLADSARIVGGGIISTGRYPDRRPELTGLRSTYIGHTAGRVGREERARRTGHAGCVIWFTGLPGSGKSTVAVALERRLFDEGRLTYLLDGDNLRRGLCADLGFSDADRTENVRRVGEAAKLLADAGVTVLVALVSPRAADRDRVRAMFRKGEFFEVHTDCPREVCEERDPKGLYRAAREGRLRGLTGFDAPYEPPRAAEVVLRTAEEGVEGCVDRVWEAVRRGGTGSEDRWRS
jgi:bifunctional enzyme CysN/CysC